VTTIGIHDLALSTGHYVLDLAELARHRGVEPDKYRLGLGQDSQSVPAADEDIVTLAAAAARPIIERHGAERIRTVLLATESGIDQSKAAGIFVHDLLDLPAATRVVELKQACYGATAGLQLAAGIVAADPGQQVLVIASDVARYDLDSPGEATQGAAAVAMLVAADPAIAALNPGSGLYTANIADFWRPNDRSTPIVVGKLSIWAYQRAVEQAWRDYTGHGAPGLPTVAAYCYHQPFTKMADKAHAKLLEANGVPVNPDRMARDLAHTKTYNRRIGNSYTASLYVSLCSLLDYAPDLTGRTVMLFSYGSGCVAEFFSVTPQPGYQRLLRRDANRHALDSREPISYERYRALRGPAELDTPVMDGADTSPFRFAATVELHRAYESR